MITRGHGWYDTVNELGRRLDALNVELKFAVESDLGLPVFSISPNPPPLAVDIVFRAESVVQETCVKCGGYGRLSYGEPVHGRRARVMCDQHRYDDWNIVD